MLVLLALAISSPFAQTQRAPTRVIQNVAPIELAIHLNKLPIAPAWQPGDPTRQVKKRYYGGPFQEPVTLPQIDPLLQNQGRFQQFIGNNFGTPLLNVAGQGFNGANPPDTMGAVGIQYFIQATNGDNVRFTIFNKADGSIAAGPFAMGDFVPCGNRGDPIIHYDQLARRWLLASLGEGNSMCVLISKTADPITGGWWSYGFPTDFIPDYLKISIWPNGYYVTTNEGDGPAIYALERDKMLDGLPADIQRFLAPALIGFNFQALTPASLDGRNQPQLGAPAQFLRHRDIQVHGTSLPGNNQDLLERFEVMVDWNDAGLSALVGPIAHEVAPFDSTLCGLNNLECIPQPNGPMLDPLGEIIMNRLVYRNLGTHETIFGNFTVDTNGFDHAGIRWFELRKLPSSPWMLHQEGTLAPDNDHRWLGSAAMDAAGNQALAYQIAGALRFPGLRYSGRLNSDPLGTLTDGEHILAEGSAANSSNRYGDYMALTVDPIDDCTFWLTGMYNPAANWSTRIASFAFQTLAAGPQNIQAIPNQANQIEVTWDPIIQATSYSIFRKVGTCDDSFYALLAEDLNQPNFTDTDVSGGVTYSYKVRSFGSVQECGSAFSSCVSATADGSCQVPPNFSGIQTAQSANQGTCGILLTWEPPAFICPAGISYNIYRSLYPNFVAGPANLLTTCAAGNQFIDQDVQPGVRYYYRIRAEDGSNLGSGPCNSGNEDANDVTLSAIATGPGGKTCDFTCSLEPQNWPLFDVLLLVACVNHPKP